MRFDLLGAAMLTVSVGGLMYALARVRDVGLAPSIALAVAVGLVALVAFVAAERRAASPLVPLAFFGRRNFTAPILSNAFMGAAYMGAFVLAPFVLLGMFEFSFTMASAIMLLRTLTLTLSSPVGASLGMRAGERAASVTGCAVMTVSLAVLALAVREQALWAIGVGLVLQGLGHGLALPSLTSSVSNAVPEEDLGIASASNRLTGQVGTSFGITLLTMVYGGVNTGESFAWAFGAGGVLSLLSLLAALGMERDPTPAER